MSNSKNMQIMIKADVLGAPVDGVYMTKKTDEKLKLGSNNDKTDCILNVQTMLVYGSPEKPTRVSLMELVNQLGKLFTGGFVTRETIKNALPDKLQEVLNSIEFSINVIYFTKVTPTLSTTVSDKKEALSTDVDKNNGVYSNPNSEAAKLLAAKTKNSEYAVWVNVHVNPALMNDLPVSVTDLSFKVWSTDNAKILDEMEITGVNKMLEGAGIALNAPSE